MATTRITPDNDSVVTEIEIAAPPARVFRALIEREQALQWGGGEAFEITEWEMDARPAAAGCSLPESAAEQAPAKLSNIMVKFCRSSLRVCWKFPGLPIGIPTRRTAPWFAGS